MNKKDLLNLSLALKSASGEILPLAAGHRALALAAGVLELHDGEQGEDWREESVRLIALSVVNVFSPSSPCNALFLTGLSTFHFCTDWLPMIGAG